MVVRVDVDYGDRVWGDGLRGKAVRDHWDRADWDIALRLFYRKRYYESFLDATITVE